MVESSGKGEKIIKSLLELSRFSIRFYFQKFHAIKEEINFKLGNEYLIVLNSQKSIDNFLNSLK